MLHNFFYFSKASSVSHVLLREETHCRGAGITSVKLCRLLCLNVIANTVSLSVYFSLGGLILGGAYWLTEMFISMPSAFYHGGCFKVRRLVLCFVCIFCLMFHKPPSLFSLLDSESQFLFIHLFPSIPEWEHCSTSRGSSYHAYFMGWLELKFVALYT